MVYPLSAALGAVLCGLGLIGLALGAPGAEAAGLRGTLVHDVLCLLTGIVVLMGTVERRGVARRLCMAAAAVHTAFLVLAIIHTIVVAGLVTVRGIDLCVSAAVVVSCITVLRMPEAARRRLRSYGSPRRSSALILAVAPQSDVDRSTT